MAENRPLCIYHGNCADGFTAAWVVNRAVVNCDFHPGVYGEEPPDVAGRDVIMVDFSYKRSVLNKIALQANSTLILDHHKTAQQDLQGIADAPPWQYWLRSPPSSVAAVFDMDRSGAQITWDYFFNRKRPLLVDYVGDRDLWQFKLPYSREINAYIFSWEYTFSNWEHLAKGLHNRDDIEQQADAGAAIERKHHKDLAELVEVTGRSMRIGGIRMPVANIPYTMTSDAGHLMAKEDQGVAACYWDTPKGRVFSLRSTEDGPDVSAIAARYGGGGHAHAAGFRRPLGWEGDEELSDGVRVQEVPT